MTMHIFRPACFLGAVFPLSAHVLHSGADVQPYKPLSAELFSSLLRTASRFSTTSVRNNATQPL